MYARERLRDGRNMRWEVDTGRRVELDGGENARAEDETRRRQERPH